MAKELKELCSRSENYSQWYTDLVIKADLAENSAVRGCMVIKPYGYSIWEKCSSIGQNVQGNRTPKCLFPLFIPKSFLSREAEHVEGFAKECAVVHITGSKIPDGNQLIVDPEAKLEEELVVRPTSETIIWSTYKDWIQSTGFAHIMQSMGQCGPLGNAYQVVFAHRRIFVAGRAYRSRHQTGSRRRSHQNVEPIR